MPINNPKLSLLIPLDFKSIAKKTLVLIFLLLLGCDWFGQQELSFKGDPKAQSVLNPATWNRTLNSTAFKVGYSDKRGNPLWVAYRLKPVPEGTAKLKRPSHFSADWRAINKITHQDYAKSGYDRGHLAPNYAISSLYGKQAQLETFVMTNISPQKPNLNRKLWQRLEEVEINHFTLLSPELWVLTGPVFDDAIERLKTADKVEIPDAFYKIYAISNQGGTFLLAFLIPQTVKGDEPLERYVETVDKIEQLTGLDFFSELDDNAEAVLESTLNTQVWKLAEVSQLPSRY